MSWKEQFDGHFFRSLGNELTPDADRRKKIKAFISTEIIEKLIADIPDNAGDCAYGNCWPSDSCSHIAVATAKLRITKQQLRDKWL